MTGNRSRRNIRLGVEAIESRCLLSVANPITGLEPLPTKSAAALDSSSATVTAHDTIIGASATRALFGVTGAGLTAAVIDTGVNYDHPAFGGGFGPGSVVVAGYDFGDGDHDPKETKGSHGTAVAGIIASRDPSAPGVAPGAEIAALRVFGDNGKGSFDGIADSLQWVINNHEKYNISVVNLSISDGKNYQSAPTLFASPVVRRIMNLIDQLEGLRIPVVTAAGNSFSGQQGMGFTAIVDNTISVTGTDGTSRLAPDAQRLGREAGGKFATDLAAPGRNVMGPWTGSSFAPLDGTSFAAPLVTGSVLLLQELHLTRFGTLPTVDQIESWLRDSAAPMRDPATGFTIGRLDVVAAASKVPLPPSSTPSQGGGQGGTVSTPKPPEPTTPPAPSNPGTPINPPSTPVAEPPASSGGSSTPSNGSTPNTPATPPPSNDSPTNAPGSSSGNGNGNGSGKDPSKAPVTPVPPSDESSSPSTPGENSAPPSPSTPPPAGQDSSPSSPAEQAPPAQGPETAKPSHPVVIAPNDPGPETPAAPDQGTPPAVPPVVVDAALDEIRGDDDSDDDADAVTDLVEADRPAPEPVVNDAAQRLAALFAPGGASLGVRAWNVSRPGMAPVWSRAQILRSQRAATLASVRATRMESAKPVPAASVRQSSV